MVGRCERVLVPTVRQRIVLDEHPYQDPVHFYIHADGGGACTGKFKFYIDHIHMFWSALYEQ